MFLNCCYLRQGGCHQNHVQLNQFSTWAKEKAIKTSRCSLYSADVYCTPVPTHQLTVVGSQTVGVGVGEEQQLGVGVDGEVGLDDGLVPADEIGNVLDLDLRLSFVPAEGVTTGVAGGSHACNQNNITQSYRE